MVQRDERKVRARILIFIYLFFLILALSESTTNSKLLNQRHVDSASFQGWILPQPPLDKESRIHPSIVSFQPTVISFSFRWLVVKERVKEEQLSFLIFFGIYLLLFQTFPSISFALTAVGCLEIV